MVNRYVDSKDKKEEEVIDVESEVEETKCDCQDEAEADEEVEAEADEETEADEEAEEKFDYRVYGKETVEETKNMAENFFNDVVNTLKSKQTEWNKTIADYTSNKPSADLYEYEDELIIKVDLPRVEKENIDIKMSTESVEIEAEFPDDLEDESDVKILRRERCSGKTKTIVYLPVEVDIKDVKASFEDYVLTITLPKIHGKKVDVEIV